ncbi:MAG: exodeoxyribonuclease I [Gammaproteobacteria bacterium TMED1]|nr:MAG: exodeoxyribonuclease I [Gammaproteobacteria bacterium TMED1]|tara:strand:- start:5090 stop:6502 length:1413 start_codon:yes stop_codon:yes gene_type:complete
MAPTFFWYDLETTGLDPLIDRPLQFAGVRTDIDLTPIESSVNIFCLPGNDVLPNPEAILVTGLSMSRLSSIGSNEVEFCRRIMSAFSVPETCVVGYNSLSFDDEFVRQMCYRNFCDPYAREWRGGNSRWDVINMFRMAYALRPGGIEWPRDEAGLVTFRLEELTKANGIEHRDAHDAVSDVLATIALTKLLRKCQPRLFEFLYALRKKDRVAQILNFADKKPIIHVSPLYGARRSCVGIILPLCKHPRNPNGFICYDLSFNPTEMINSTATELDQILFSTLENWKQGSKYKPLITLYKNRCPAIAPLTSMTNEDMIRLGISFSECLDHMRQIQNSNGLSEKIKTVFSERTFQVEYDPDKMLYQGDFFGDHDRSLMDQVHKLHPDQLQNIEGQFEDERLNKMLFRFRARNYPNILSAEEEVRWNSYRMDRWNGGRAIKDILEKLKKMQENSETPYLGDLVNYIGDISDGVL